MKIPSKIRKLLKRRCDLALKLISVDLDVSKFVLENNISVEEDDYLSGSEMYSNPIDSMERIIKAIEEKE